MTGCAGMPGVREVSQTYWREDLGRLNPATLAAGVQLIYADLFMEVRTGVRR